MLGDTVACVVHITHTISSVLIRFLVGFDSNHIFSSLSRPSIYHSTDNRGMTILVDYFVLPRHTVNFVIR